MFHPSAASSDEREIALELSQQVGSNFIEFNHSTHPALNPIKGFGLKPNWPTSNLIHLKIEHDIMRLAKELNISNFVSGHDGR
ncbi:MAG TPA: hypothetical protein QKA08_05240 [Candidatus Megaira endosymbiont of Nemacystus decipiens]|nr:hypothetical protein [Candidatus Megaera endosymbiont of Nemacystus decipiens]